MKWWKEALCGCRQSYDDDDDDDNDEPDSLLVHTLYLLNMQA